MNYAICMIKYKLLVKRSIVDTINVKLQDCGIGVIIFDSDMYNGSVPPVLLEAYRRCPGIAKHTSSSGPSADSALAGPEGAGFVDAPVPGTCAGNIDTPCARTSCTAH